jgi:hypothetical protein
MDAVNRLLLAWLLLFAATPVRADSTTFDEHVARGQQLYLARDYERAIAELEAAYALRPVNRLLFNLGMAYRKLGDARMALSFFERYRDGRKAIDAKVPIDRYIEELRAQVAAEPSAGEPRATVEPSAVEPSAAEPSAAEPGAAAVSPPPPSSAAPAEASPPAPMLAAPASPAPARAMPLVSAAPPSPTPSRRPRRIWTKWWFWTSTALAAGAAATAIAVGVTQGHASEPAFVVHAR